MKDNLQGLGIGLVFAALLFGSAALSDPAKTTRTYTFDFDRKIPGAVICYYKRGDKEFRLTIRNEENVYCPVSIEIRL